MKEAKILTESWRIERDTPGPHSRQATPQAQARDHATRRACAGVNLKPGPGGGGRSISGDLLEAVGFTAFGNVKRYKQGLSQYLRLQLIRRSGLRCRLCIHFYLERHTSTRAEHNINVSPYIPG